MKVLFEIAITIVSYMYIQKRHILYIHGNPTFKICLTNYAKVVVAMKVDGSTSQMNTICHAYCK